MNLHLKLMNLHLQFLICSVHKYLRSASDIVDFQRELELGYLATTNLF